MLVLYKADIVIILFMYYNVGLKLYLNPDWMDLGIFHYLYQINKTNNYLSPKIREHFIYLFVYKPIATKFWLSI
jgi:hypothetical protein